MLHWNKSDIRLPVHPCGFKPTASDQPKFFPYPRKKTRPIVAEVLDVTSRPSAKIGNPFA